MRLLLPVSCLRRLRLQSPGELLGSGWLAQHSKLERSSDTASVGRAMCTCARVPLFLPPPLCVAVWGGERICCSRQAVKTKRQRRRAHTHTKKQAWPHLANTLRSVHAREHLPSRDVERPLSSKATRCELADRILLAHDRLAEGDQYGVLISPHSQHIAPLSSSDKRRICAVWHVFSGCRAMDSAVLAWAKVMPSSSESVRSLPFDFVALMSRCVVWFCFALQPLFAGFTSSSSFPS